MKKLSFILKLKVAMLNE